MTYSMEPMMPPEGSKVLEDLAFELSLKAQSLASSVNPIISQSLSTLIKSMNCYYSNLIEGHFTHPRDINRALHEDYETQPEKRNLQLEARAHIEVQNLINELPPHTPVVNEEFLLWLHKEFYLRLPEELWIVKNPETGAFIKVIPGHFRTSDVQIGMHIPPTADELPLYMKKFVSAYDSSRYNKLRQTISVAAAHHRFAWIHPFYDGNGRVVRLFSDAFLKSIGIRNDLWSVSRGLARTVQDYKRLLAAADSPRRNDFDGRGNLSEKGLIDFCTYFLKICIDQVNFMESLLDLKNFLPRLENVCEEYIAQGEILPGSYFVLREAFFLGELERGKIPSITGYKERQARSIISRLIQKDFLTSDSPKGKIRLNFPYKIVDKLFPNLYPHDLG